MNLGRTFFAFGSNPGIGQRIVKYVEVFHMSTERFSDLGKLNFPIVVWF